MSDYNVYLVEDEENLSQVLKAYMEQEGWNVTVFDNGEEAAKNVEDTPHLWILDIMLPGIDGYEVLRKIKQHSDTPVIFISARDQDLDRIVGLELGSDDYLAKPFMPRELVIRAKKLLIRVYESGAMVPKKIEITGYIIDPVARKITFDEELINLTSKEMDVLLYLIENLGTSKAREEILAHVWGSDYFGSERAVDDVIRRVRKKMPRLNLETVYGNGYRIVTS
ncbi:response regulator transcription factor [Fictibacillus sp. WQ 8-8]|uniref:response regulator transcription factor n=1 Tax=unclassified Fictibacillus TaxID=2644029 RepID=UPI0006A75856|nr:MULTISPECIES: response regulator transcription factor [unclassified Fictibacillus]MCQ6267047.1 response regulator transcription factor [Fictibacillus sp. WQ 8-8]MED2972178.1 response regulator transcription factor [Fictibacillus sp. B-59209]SFE22619.1 two-component system, OmpR family, response regulator CssR [Bacillus sp. OV194]